ncbi:hypothetical protein AB1K83_10095 [Sporosarcina sp. 179-K 3D1 HS]|uniref:hypothetical protein n=1 Tax=Sporosarcina sp. 179-K 3D1 HS TaxID=3232169 RepID=UPI0039A01C85
MFTVTMFGLATLLIPIVIIMLLLFKPMKKVSRRIWLGRKWTYLLFGTYIAILLIATLTVDFLDTQAQADLPIVEEQSDNQFFENIRAGDFEAIPSERILREQTYPVQDGFAIAHAIPDFENSPHVILKWKDTDDGLIEEKVFRPLLAVNHYDLSDRADYVLPKWEDNQVTILRQPSTPIQLNSYNDAVLVNQFTSAPRRNMGFSSSMSRDLVIYLHVPKGLEIDIDDGIYVEEITEP